MAKVCYHPTSYYYSPANGHSCEDYHTGETYRFWYDPTGVWMAEKFRFPQAEANESDLTSYL